MFNYSKTKKRCKVLRKKILELSQNVQAIHIGGSFSSVEIIDVIFAFLKKKNETFILSKGHAGILLYVILNFYKILKDKDLKNYCKKKGFLGVHPDYGTPGVSASTGSLGHGLGIAAGIAIAEKEEKKKTYVLISDGELLEGSVWENILFISSNKLNNIILIVDNNNLQSSTRMNETHPTAYPINKKFISFGWDCKVCNGHNSKKILDLIRKRNKNKPFALIAKTQKGYPVSFMKNNPIWHYRSPDKSEYNIALAEIEKS